MVSGSKALYSISVAVFQVCVTKAMSIYKMQSLVELFVDIKILCSIRSICELLSIGCERLIESEYSKTGDFIPNLYWSGCNNDWLTCSTWLTGI